MPPYNEELKETKETISLFKDLKGAFEEIFGTCPDIYNLTVLSLVIDVAIGFILNGSRDSFENDVKKIEKTLDTYKDNDIDELEKILEKEKFNYSLNEKKIDKLSNDDQLKIKNDIDLYFNGLVPKHVPKLQKKVTFGKRRRRRSRSYRKR